MFHKKILAGIIILSNLFSASFALAYRDVDTGSLLERATDHLIDYGVITEPGIVFNPNVPIMRADYLEWLLRNQSFNPKTYNTKYYFRDVTRESEYAPYVARAVELGLVDPSGNYFNPKAYLTRLEALTWLMYAEGIPVPLSHDDADKFIDLKETTERALVQKALDLTLVEPSDSRYFGANFRLTRGEAATWIYRVSLMGTSNFELGSFSIELSDILDGELSVLQDIWDLIHSDYYMADTTDYEDVRYSAIEGMIKGLGDKHSAFQRPDESLAFGDDLAGEFDGIGTYMETNEKDEMLILAPLKNSPAEKAGVKAGDIIRAIDGESMDGLDTYEISRKIKGPAGTDVTITFERDGKLIDITITRARIEIPSLDWEYRDNVGIIHIYEFTDNVGDQFATAVDELMQKAPQSIILDLRDNPGGYIDAAAKVLNYFFPHNDPIFKVWFDEESSLRYESAGSDIHLYDMPIAILQNPGSASASEIISLVLQEEKGAIVVGEQSYGKGTAQRLYPMSDGSILKLSVARWTTNSDTSINGIGITPDIEVEDNENDYRDPVLERAIRELNK